MISDSTNAKLLFSTAPLHGSTQSVGDTTSACARLQEAYDEQHILVQQQQELLVAAAVVPGDEARLQLQLRLTHRLKQ